MIGRVALIQPPDPPRTQCLRDHMGMFGILKSGLSLVRDDILPPLMLAYSASILENSGFEVKLIDATASGYGVRRCLAEIKKFNPGIAVVSSAGVSNSHDLDFAEEIKAATGAIVSVTGPHLTLDPEVALQRSGIDVVICGEIEHTILELSQKIFQAKRFEDAMLGDVKGIAFRKDGRTVRTGKRPLIMNLDELPFPAFHLLPMKKYRFNMLDKAPFTTCLTSRGCPFKCVYCPYPIGYGNVWRGRSPENVIEELMWMTSEFGIKSLLFRDQVFTFDMKRTENICDSMIREGIDIEWRCETRVDRISKNLLTKMKKAGCSGVHFGVESGDPGILSSMGKSGDVSIDQIKKAFSDSKEVGLSTVGYFLIGLPGENKETIRRTVELARELDADESWFNSPVPYPGTMLHEIAKKNGWILTDDLRRYSGTEVVMRTDALSEKDIEEALNETKAMFPGKYSNLVKLFFTKKGFVSSITNPRAALKYAARSLKRRSMT